MMMSKIGAVEGGILSSLLLFAAITILPSIIEKIKKILKSYHNKLFNKENSIEFMGWNSIKNNVFTYEYPVPMMAICHHIVNSDKVRHLQYFDSDRNGDYYPDENGSGHNEINKDSKLLNYILSNYSNIELDNGITVCFNKDAMETTDSDNKKGQLWEVILRIKSNRHTCQQLSRFTDRCIQEYQKFNEQISYNKIYHFIYTGKNNDGRIKFNMSILSDNSDITKQSFETFDNIFSPHKKQIQMDIERLRDVEYYRRTGLKRKKGYLFYGPPGCGKTSTVVAMALMDNRHIIEIPMCRVKTNKELEDIFAMNEINKVKIDKNKVILLFDEIDTGMENVSKPTKNPIKAIKKQLKKMTSISSSNAGSTNDSEDEGEEDDVVDFGVKTKDEEDKINIGTILSRLDGIGNYNGLIIVGTTNSITKLTPALYREGRLTPLYFENITSEDIKMMIEHVFKVELNKQHVRRLPDKKLTPVSVRFAIEKYENMFYRDGEIKNKREYVEMLIGDLLNRK